MAVTTVENLSINIKRTGDNASFSLGEMSKSLKEVKGSSQSATKGLGSLASSLQRIAYYRIIRSIIKVIGKAFQEGAENAYFFSKAVGGDLAAALDLLSTKSFTMTNQLGASWATLLQTIQPVLLKLIELVRMAAEAITQFFAVLGGKKTYLKAIDYSKDWATTTAAGAKAAKEWKNQLMGFDEINRLEDSSGSGGGSGKVLPNYAQLFEEMPINTKLTDLIDTIKAHIADLEVFAAGAFLGIGLLLALTGTNVPLGLGLIAVGALTMAHALSENWDYLTDTTKSKLMTLENAIHGAEFGVGLVLALSGVNIPLGIGLMAMGALGFAHNAALNWDEMPDTLKRKIKDIEDIVGMASLGVGALLTFTNVNVPLGLALMALGAVNLARAASIGDSGLVETIRRTLGEIMYLVGISLAAIGLILLMVPGAQTIALGLIAAGMMSFGTGMMLNPDTFLKLADTIGKVLGEIMLVVGISLAAIGLILLMVPGMQTLGLGLIAAGMMSFGAGMVLDPNAFLGLVDTICGGINTVIGWVQTLFNWAKTATQQLSEMFKAKVANSRNLTDEGMYLQGFASGGFPSEGELFVAREAGPELVGQIGGKTAVANNDQIVQGITAGVYNAVVSAMSMSGGGNNDTPVKIYLDGREIASTTTKYQKQFARIGTM